MARLPAYSPTRPALPGPVAIGEPLQAATPDSMATAVSGYLGFLALGTVARQHLVGDMQYDGVDADFPAFGPLQDVPDRQAPAPIRIRRTSAGRYLWLGIWALAQEEAVKGAANAPPSITATLRDADDVIVDGPIEWSVTNGYLSTSTGRLTNARLRAWAAAGATPDPAPGDLGDINAAWLAEWRDAGETPERFMSTGRAIEPSATDPRMLAYPADDYREFSLEITAVGARIYSVSVLEAYIAEGGS